MRENYTTAERRTINRAYDALERLCDDYDVKAPGMLRCALSHERRNRDVTLARVLILECWAEGHAGKYDAARLYGLSDGCASAAMIGAFMAARPPADEWRLQNALDHAREAAKANQAHTDRMVEAFSRGAGRD